jgi:hypothetical protein
VSSCTRKQGHQTHFLGSGFAAVTRAASAIGVTAFPADPSLNFQPVQALGPHTAPLGMRFYHWRDTPGAFPREYDGTAFVAEHGSWNRAVKIGYRVMMLRVNGATGAVTDYKPFASGWLQNEGVAAHNFTWGECKGAPNRTWGWAGGGGQGELIRGVGGEFKCLGTSTAEGAPARG